MKIKKRTKIFLLILAVIFIFLAVWTIIENNSVKLTEYTVSSDKLPSEFSGFKIAHISDLHNAEFGKDNKKLVEIIASSQPDIIAITGDIIDSYDTDIEVATSFLTQLIKIAPCYYVTGNHESRIEKYDEFKSDIIKLGVTVLENENVKFEKSGEYINIFGVEDPSFYTDYLFGNSQEVMKWQLQNMTENGFTVLLSHRPELFEVYAQSGADLVLSGHAHGGQFRLPFIGGVVAPNQGLFPKYDSGLFTKGDTNMIVSRGIGNSIFPFRFNNPPEVVIITLKANSL